MLQAGSVLGNYEIVSPIAGGGMGVVYRAKHRYLGTLHAVKILTPSLSLDEKVRVRFTQEAYVQAQLKDHPNIVAVTDFLDEPSELGFVMDLIEGPALAQVIESDRSGPWTVADAMKVLEPVMEALAYAHSRHVVHRDIKPANVMLDRSIGGIGIPKVTDFGLAKILASEGGMTRTGAMMGTLPYMAPEQFRGAKDVDPRADVFALGMMLWRLLTGTLPANPTDISLCSELYLGRLKIPDLTDRIPAEDAGVCRVMTRALSIEPGTRPSNAAELLHELRGAVSHPPIEPDGEVNGPGISAAVFPPAPKLSPAGERVEKSTVGSRLGAGVAPPSAPPTVETQDSHVTASTEEALDEQIGDWISHAHRRSSSAEIQQESDPGEVDEWSRRNSLSGVLIDLAEQAQTMAWSVTEDVNRWIETITESGPSRVDAETDEWAQAKLENRLRLAVIWASVGVILALFLLIAALSC